MASSEQQHIEGLVKEVYELGAVKRDMWRRAGFEQAQTIAVLNIVYRRGPVRVGAVAEDLHVDMSVASRQLSALEAAGHIERTPDPDDGRSRLLAITPAGEEALGAAHEAMVGVFATTVADWSQADIDDLAASIGRLRSDYARAVAEARVAGAQPAMATAGAEGAR
ncbi:MAG: MarR family winged helix-turn-helix transcriptional regulator [Thermoleophilaceae bacterium]